MSDWNSGAGALANCFYKTMVSSITGRTYEVSVALPYGYDESAASYPVLYATDANGMFGLVVESARMLEIEGLIPDLVIVGIGYPVGMFWNAISARFFDLTPTPDDEYLSELLASFPDVPPLEGTGGGEGFLRFIREELAPAVSRDFRVDASRSSLAGYSAGGLLALYAFFNHHEAFEGYLAGAPALGWDKRVTFEYEKTFASSGVTPSARLFMSVGSDDALVDPKMMIEMADLLSAAPYKTLPFSFHVFQDETHNSAIPATVSRGLRFLYGSPRAN